MKILLISPCKDPAIKRSKYLMIPQLALHLLAGLTPPEHEVKIIEEEIERINLDEECDLVGISCMTSNAPRAYELAREFRLRGRKVVLGGVHPTILPDEALQHADSVVIGEGEGVWEKLLIDFKQGRLLKKYYVPFPPLDRYVRIRNRRDTKKRIFDAVPVMTTRGCPFRCEFCCVHDIFGRAIRHVPVENVVRDIVDSGGRCFLFLDDNIIGDPHYAKTLFKALKPLGIKWGGQASISFVRDVELMKLAVESGCIALFFGLESVSTSQLKKMRKSLKDLRDVEEAIKKIKDMGIYFHPSMIFGFDDDTKDTFPETLDFLSKNRISSASLNILTPYPGTEIFRRLDEEGRLLTRNWRHYNHTTAVFKPAHMTPFELQSGWLWVVSEFYKLPSILNRLPSHLDHPLLHLAMNAGSWVGYRSDLRNFPKLASELFPLEEEAPELKFRLPLGALTFSDFLPKR